jgi:hypothetical protein
MLPLEFICDNPQNTLHKHHRNLKPLETLAWIGTQKFRNPRELVPQKLIPKENTKGEEP